jgi:hypothetical protein
MRKTTLNCCEFHAYPGPNGYGEIMLKIEEYLIETADQCSRLVREGRELIARLDAISQELMARAVEFNTARQKEEKAKQ